MIPLLVVTGVDATSMAAATVGLQWDLPGSVVIRHHLDVPAAELTRTVSDAAGVVEEASIDLDGACVGCSLDEDLIPVVERLARTGRWASIVLHLPPSMEARPLCHALEQHEALRRLVAVAAVVAVLRGGSVRHDLLGSAGLLDIGAEAAPDDDRGVGEVLAAQVEYADAVICMNGCDDTARELLAALARPDAIVQHEPFLPDGARLLALGHRTERSDAWTAPLRAAPLPPLAGRRVWRLDLASARPFHPDRLMTEIEELGGGPHRSRGCFWLPTRPGDLCGWDGCGGHLSIGTLQADGHRPPSTRIVIVGDWETEAVNALVTRFERCLLTDSELAERGSAWEVHHDGFEPWLGAIGSRDGVRLPGDRP
nr:GTP-binding protein [Propionicimonas sp.]